VAGEPAKRWPSVLEFLADDRPRRWLAAGRVEELLQTLRQRAAPFDIDRCQDKSIELKKLNPDHFGKGGNRLCAADFGG
jgi:hypothetical protein